MHKPTSLPWSVRFLLLLILVLFGVSFSEAQDRLPSMPGYDRYQKMSKEIPGAVKLGTLSVSWKDGGKAFEYRHEGKSYRYDIATRKATEATASKDEPAPGGRGGRFGGRGGTGRVGGDQAPGVARGRQLGSANSPDGQYRAIYRDRNVWLSDAKGIFEMPITSDGNEKGRIKNGVASWVYGEELAQRTAIWWSPDSKKVAFYRFDESKVADYFLPLEQTGLQTKVDVEPYPKVGTPNPIAEVLVYDLTTKKTVRVDVRDGKPFTDAVVGHYVYRIAWSADGKELLFNRTNRKQNIMEFVAANPESGKCRVIVREEWPASWVVNSPQMRYLADNRRFVWTSERNGWRNYYLYDLSGKLLNPLTQHQFEVGPIVRVDEAAGAIYYMARSGDNPMKLQLHRVGLDGKGDRRLTEPNLNHTVDIAPDGKHFIDIAQSHKTPPMTRLVDANGEIVTELARSDLTRAKTLGLKPVELFTFKAADGKTDLHGMLHFPSQFDPSRKYPLLISVYAGPNTNGANENFTLPSALTEYGFLFARLDSRSADGRGKHFLDAIYGKLGVVEVDDQAAGVKTLAARPYVDGKRVGIYGTSYGGYVSALAVLRHPDVFHAACASSPVTDFRLYDSIYTERYMGLPRENKAGYDAGNAMNYVNKLKGRLMLFFGTADNNVHPSNSLQLIRALQRAGKSFEVQVGPDQGHAGISQPRMMEFFIENLVLNSPKPERKGDGRPATREGEQP